MRRIFERLKEYPQVFLYTLSVMLFMSAFYHSAPDVALWAGMLLVATGYYTATVTDK